MRLPRETQHARMARRQVQDATALRTIVACLRAVDSPNASEFACDVVVTLSEAWRDGLTDRLRLSAHDPVALAAQATGYFTWGRGERFRNLRNRVRLARAHPPAAG